MELINIARELVDDVRQILLINASDFDLGRAKEKLDNAQHALNQMTGKGHTLDGNPELSTPRESEIIRYCLEYCLDNEFALGGKFTKEEVKKLLEEMGGDG